jgi:hypothetical protein
VGQDGRFVGAQHFGVWNLHMFLIDYTFSSLNRFDHSIIRKVVSLKINKQIEEKKNKTTFLS